jgi:hypothetical protein
MAHAQDADPPMFADFKSFCIATGADPNAMKVVVEANGARLLRPPASTTYPFPMTTTIWEQRLSDRVITVAAGSIYSPARIYHAEYGANACTLTSHTNDDASVDAIRKWIGIPPERVSPGGLTIYFFDYVETASGHAAVPSDNTAREAAAARGELWHVVLLHAKDGASVQVMHDIPPSNSAKQN